MNRRGFLRSVFASAALATACSVPEFPGAELWRRARVWLVNRRLRRVRPTEFREFVFPIIRAAYPPETLADMFEVMPMHERPKIYWTFKRS